MAEPTLADIRRDIDRIDQVLHDHLIERSMIIDRLIAIKKKQGSGSAFRPDREASMLKALAERHEGRLPFDAIESIWRIIISTFTFVQAPYAVHGAGETPALRDAARFHFGFTVPFHVHLTLAETIAAVHTSSGDLGLVPVTADARDGVWWRDLIGADRPKIIARLPFVAREDHPAGLPLFIVSKPLADQATPDRALFALRVERWPGAVADALASDALRVEAAATDGTATGGTATALLLSAPGTTTHDQLQARLVSHNLPPLEIAPVGSCPDPFLFHASDSAS
jgi:chorismate mutase